MRIFIEHEQGEETVIVAGRRSTRVESVDLGVEPKAMDELRALAAVSASSPAVAAIQAGTALRRYLASQGITEGDFRLTLTAYPDAPAEVKPVPVAVRPDEE